MRMVGADPHAKVVGLEELPGKSNYFIGNDPKKWRTNVPNYAKVKYANVYPGVDLVYYGNQGQLEYDFVVQPNADPQQIELQIAASASRPPNAGETEKLNIDSNGDLVVQTGGGEVRFHRPVVYQYDTSAGGRHLVEGQYVLRGDDRIAFQLGHYDRRLPVVIDPTLAYSSYLGGNESGDYAQAIAVDAAGNAYITGFTGSADFPTTPGAFQATKPGFVSNAFVSKLNATGSALVYSTYLGGHSTNGEQGFGIAIDTSGNAYVTGFARSADFPTTPGAFQTTKHGVDDAFVSKLNATGSVLIYSTYLGGSTLPNGGAASSSAAGIAVDTTGNAYVTGNTNAADFPTTPGALQTANGGGAFISKLNAAGSALLYSTYLGAHQSEGHGIAVNASGNAYVTGITSDPNFPTTAGAFSTVFHTKFAEAFVSKLNPRGSALLYSTYLGGNDSDAGNGIAVDALGNAYIAGASNSVDFPTTLGAFQTTFGGGIVDAFLSKLNPTGSALLYSTYLGGNDIDVGTSIAIDAAGNSYVAGYSFSSNFPTTVGAIQTTLGGTHDAFVAKIGSEQEQQIVNDKVNFVVQSTFLDPNPVPGGPAGVFTITARLTNTSTENILEPINAIVRTLTNGNKLLSATEGSGGAGSKQAIDTGADNVLIPNESATVQFRIGLANRNRFSFFLDVSGIVGEGD